MDLEDEVCTRGQGQDNISVRKITIGDTRLWKQRETEFPHTSLNNLTDKPTFDIRISPDIEEVDRYKNGTSKYHTSLYPIEGSSESYNHYEAIIGTVRQIFLKNNNVHQKVII